MLKKITIAVIILLVFTLIIHSCKKKAVHDLSREEEKIAARLAELPAFKENRKLFEKLAVEARKDTTKKSASKYTFEDYKSMKENPYFTNEEKEDSLKRMGFRPKEKSSLPATVKKLIADIARNSQTIIRELPEYAALNSQGRFRVMNQASILYRENSKSKSLD